MNIKSISKSLLSACDNILSTLSLYRFSIKEEEFKSILIRVRHLNELVLYDCKIDISQSFSFNDTKTLAILEPVSLKTLDLRCSINSQGCYLTDSKLKTLICALSQTQFVSSIKLVRISPNFVRLITK